MSSADNPKQILLSGDPLQYEAPAALLATVTPGQILVYSGSDVAPGAADTMRVARELSLAGETIDDDYSELETVVFYTGRKGDRFYCLLAEDNDVSVGDALEANSDGNLALQSSGTTIAVAVEAVNNPLDSGQLERIKVETV